MEGNLQKSNLPHGFSCPQWEKGSHKCVPYFPKPLASRLMMAFIGSIAGITAPALKILSSWSLPSVPGPLANGIPLPGILLVGAAIVGFFVALNHEKEPFAVFFAAAGIPALVFAAMSIPGLSL